MTRGTNPTKNSIHETNLNSLIMKGCILRLAIYLLCQVASVGRAALRSVGRAALRSVVAAAMSILEYDGRRCTFAISPNAW